MHARRPLRFGLAPLLRRDAWRFDIAGSVTRDLERAQLSLGLATLASSLACGDLGGLALCLDGKALWRELTALPRCRRRDLRRLSLLLDREALLFGFAALASGVAHCGVCGLTIRTRGQPLLLGLGALAGCFAHCDLCGFAVCFGCEALLLEGVRLRAASFVAMSASCSASLRLRAASRAAISAVLRSASAASRCCSASLRLRAASLAAVSASARFFMARSAACSALLLVASLRRCVAAGHSRVRPASSRRSLLRPERGCLGVLAALFCFGSCTACLGEPLLGDLRIGNELFAIACRGLIACLRGGARRGLGCIALANRPSPQAREPEPREPRRRRARRAPCPRGPEPQRPCDSIAACWCLASRQPGQQRQRGPGAEVLQRQVGRVRRARQGGLRDVLQRHRRPPGPPPSLVHRAAAADREQPGPPGPLVAAKVGQPPDDLDPGLGGDVLGGVRGDHPQVAQQDRVAIPP